MSRILWGFSFAILMLNPKIASQGTSCSLPRCLLRPLEQYAWAEVGENVFGLWITSFPGQICHHCHSSSSLFEDSFQPTFAPDEEPAHQQNPHGLSHQVHRVLQGNFLEEEGYCILIERSSNDREREESTWQQNRLFVQSVLNLRRRLHILLCHFCLPQWEKLGRSVGRRGWMRKQKKEGVMKGEFMPVTYCLGCSVVLSLSGTWLWDEPLSLGQGCKGTSDVWWKALQKFCFLDGLVSINWRCLHTDIPSWASHPGLLLRAEYFHQDSSFGIYWIQGNLQCSNTHFSLLAVMSPHLFAYKYHPSLIFVNELEGSGSCHVLAISLGVEQQEVSEYFTTPWKPLCFDSWIITAFPPCSCQGIVVPWSLKMRMLRLV